LRVIRAVSEFTPPSLDPDFEPSDRLAERLIWFDNQLRRGGTIVFGPPTHGMRDGSLRSGYPNSLGEPTRRLDSRDTESSSFAGAITRLMAPAALPRDTSEHGLDESSGEEFPGDVFSGDLSSGDVSPGDLLEEQRLFDCLRGLRGLFGTLGRQADGDSAGVPRLGELWNERYEVQAALGSGAAGVVRLAHDRHLKRPVALKFPRVESGRGADRRDDLLRDAQVAARFDHRGILTVHELIIPAEGNPCLVMPYCRGGSLRTWLQAYPEPLDPRLCVRLVRELAEATQYAHERQVVHRDLKPENILLQSRRGEEHGARSAVDTRPDRLLDEWQPRIADFGLALVRETATSESETPHPMGGTLRYMAPEQMRGQVTAFGPATDVHALGVLLRELLTGQASRDRTESTPVHRAPRIPSELQRIIQRCTAPDPVDRYPTSRQLGDDLRRWETCEPVHAGRRPSLFTRLRKWVIRHRRPVGWTTVGMLLMVWGALAIARLPTRIERDWSRWGQIPTDFPFAGIEHSGNGSVHLDPKSAQLVIVSSRARMAQLGDLPHGGDLDLSLDLELSGRVDDCGVFFGYRDQQPTSDDPGCARMHAVSVSRKLEGLIPRLYVRRNIGYFLKDGRFHYAAMGQLREWLAPPRGDQVGLLRRKVRLRLQIQNGILQEISVNGQPLPQFTDPSVDQEIEEYHDLNLSGPFGVFVNGSTTVQFGLPEQNQVVTSFR